MYTRPTEGRALVAGFSQGGMLTFGLALHHPDLFDGAYPIAGWFPLHLVDSVIDPTRRYPAHIVRVGYGPTTKDNVVTYLAELSVNNDDLSLRPGMTATATITTVEHADVLLVPNAALRWMPAAAGAAPAANNRSSLVGSMMPRPPGSRPARSAGTDIAQVRQVWVLDGGTPRAVPVTPGVSDGRLTELTSEQLQPGMAVIVGQTSGVAR